MVVGGLTFLVGAAGHQRAVGALALCPVGTHLHLIVAIRVQVGEFHRGYLAVKQVGFGLRVTLDPVLYLLPGEGLVSREWANTRAVCPSTDLLSLLSPLHR